MEKRYTREVHLEVGGETRRVLVTLWGLVLAEEKGLDLSDLETDENGGEDFSTMLDFLWVGMLPFDEDLSRKDAGMMFTPADLDACQEAFNKIKSRQITADVQEVIDEGATETAPKASDT
jgi:hypothetical protein